MKTTKYLIIPALALLTACNSTDSVRDPIKVKTTPVSAAGEFASLHYSGTIEPARAIPLSFLTAGTVSGVSAREGQAVRKGEELARLDCQTNETALRMAEAKGKQAEDAFRRFEPMYKNGNLPEIKMVEIETARTEAALAVKLAAKNAADCVIKAPEDGTIGDRSVEPGSAAIPGKPVLKLLSIDKVYAVIPVPESEISSIRPGQPALVKVAALTAPERPLPTEAAPGAVELPIAGDNSRKDRGDYRGKVTDSGISADLLARTYTVRVLLDNPGRRMLPGMICNVYLGGARRGHMMLVPATSVTADSAGKSFVYISDGKKARRRAVETAGFAGGGILISSGLAEGESVVSEGMEKLSDGAAIRAE